MKSFFSFLHSAFFLQQKAIPSWMRKKPCTDRAKEEEREKEGLGREGAGGEREREQDRRWGMPNINSKAFK